MFINVTGWTHSQHTLFTALWLDKARRAGVNKNANNGSILLGVPAAIHHLSSEFHLCFSGFQNFCHEKGVRHQGTKSCATSVHNKRAEHRCLKHSWERSNGTETLDGRWKSIPMWQTTLRECITVFLHVKWKQSYCNGFSITRHSFRLYQMVSLESNKKTPKTSSQHHDMTG